MPPAGGAKRKRGDRSYSGDDFQRPSPHRPGHLNLAQNPSNYGREYSEYRGRGGRRPPRGGRHSSYNSHQQQRPREPVAESREAPQSRAEPESQTIEPQMIYEPQTIADELEPALDPSAFAHEILTSEILENWAENGRETIKTQLVAAIEVGDSTSVCDMVQEIIWAVMCAEVPSSDIGAMLRDILEDDINMPSDLENHLVPSLSQAPFLDAISVISETLADPPYLRIAQLIRDSNFDASLLRQELEGALLEKLGIVRSTFTKVAIRKQTNVLYRQANFNLMREESEGFAKLMTELFTASGSQPPTGTNVQDTVERVKAMIGAFDLDVGRSLDVVLDVFGAVLVKQFRFFVKFLRASPWWPRDGTATSHQGFETFAGLPAWALPNSEDWRNTHEQQTLVTEQTQHRDQTFWNRARDIGLMAYFQLGRGFEAKSQLPDDEIAQEWTQRTGTSKPSGNRDAAQLLGFKLRFYSSSKARDENDILPDNLIYLAALLIKIGFISLIDLYPHIWRSDEEMEELRQQKLKEKVERERASRPGAGTKNALLTAGALADDTLPIPSRTRDVPTRAGTPLKDVEESKPLPAKEVMPEPADQKVLLLKSLLAIGALPEAFFILGKFPWVLELYPEMPEYITRILHHSLTDVYATLQPLGDRESLQEQRPMADTDIPGVSKGQVKLTEQSHRKTLRWALLDRMDSTDGSDYRFYWDEWNDNVPICQTIEDVFTLCDTLLNLVGVKIGSDPTLLLKLARIGRYSMKRDPSETNRERWLSLSKRYLLPALSLTKSNAGVVNEVFELISNFSTNTRYLLYLEWSSGKTSRNPDIKTATDQARAETKDVLKRISKTNVRPMARALAKIAYANPHIVITTAIAQIEVYDSIADVFVEGARYFTDLGYDVLTWAMVSSMGREGRSRTRQGGLFTSKWLSALANFAGKLYKRYAIMKSGPILQYVEEQLGRGNSTDLIMLEQMIAAMAGISSDISFNDAQLQAMGGGDLLQQQILLQALDRRYDPSTKTSSRRLVRALKESGLSGSLLMSLALHRQSCIYEADNADAPLKLLGMVFDDIHQVLIQYLELLKANLSPDDFALVIPDVATMLVSYDLPAEVAFCVGRQGLREQIVESDKVEASKKVDEARDLPNGDIEMNDEMEEEEGEEVENDTVDESSAATPEVSSAMEQEIVNKVIEQHWHPVLESMTQKITPKLAPDVLDIVGAGFYLTFWQLSPYDVIVPSKSYDDEVSRINKKIKDIANDKSDVSLAGRKKREDQTNHLKGFVEKLLAENKQHLKAVQDVKSRLGREKFQWFAGKNRPAQLNSALLEHCFLPRLVFSPLDAHFCFKFIKLLHAAGTPGFKTLGFFDIIFRQDRLTSVIFSCSAKETDNLGRFLSEVLRDFGRWHQNKSVYEREAFGSKKQLTGFEYKPGVWLNYEEFRRLLFKWHNLLYQALSRCLESDEYMHIRNAISLMRSVSLYFPAINFHGTKLVELLKKLGENASREDLQLSSRAVLGSLYRREKFWVIPQAFRMGAERFDGSDEKPAIKAVEQSTDANDTVMIDAPKAAETAPVKPEQMAEVVPEKSASKAEPRADAKVPRADTVREPAQTNGGLQKSTNLSSQHELPKRIQPPANPASVRPATLPSRPEQHRTEPSRVAPRPPYQERPPPDRPPPERPPVDSRTRRPEDERYRHDHERRDGQRPVEFDRQRQYDVRSRPREDQRPQSRAEPPQERRPLPESARLPPRVELHSQTSARDREDDRPPPRPDPRASTFTPRGRVEDGRSSQQPFQPRSRIEDAHNNQSTATAAPVRPRQDDPSATRSRPDELRRLEATAISQRRAESPQTREGRPAPAVDTSGQTTINPARAALIEGMNTDTRPRQTRSPPREDNRRDDRNGRYPPKQVDMQKGRLEQDFSRDTDVPSGPRSRAAPRPPIPAPIVDRPVARPPPTAVDKPAPSGPRPHTRSSSVTETDGVHPDRLRQIVPPAQSPPSGPRSAIPANAPSGPSPTTRAPPSGPLNERTRRHPLNTVNTTLQQSSRGRGGRPSPVTPHANGHQDTRELFANGRDERSSRRSSPERRDMRREEDGKRDDRSSRPDPTRKHTREEIYGRGGSRGTNDTKRSRRAA